MSFQPGERLRPHAVLEELALLEGKARPGCELDFRRTPYRRIETGDVDLTVGRLQPAEQAGELLVRVGRRAAELARVQIRLRGADADLRVAQPAQSRVDGGPVRRDVGHVGDE